MTQIDGALPSEQAEISGEVEPTPELDAEARLQIAQFLHTFDLDLATQGNGGEDIATFHQQDGYDPASETARDMLIEGLSERAGFDVDEMLTRTESYWRDQQDNPDTEKLNLIVPPFVFRAMGIQEGPQHNVIVQGGVFRQAALAVQPTDEGRRRMFYVAEMEIPTRVSGEDGSVRGRTARVLYLWNKIVDGPRPEDAQVSVQA